MTKKNNPMAKDLMSPKYKPRVKQSRKAYKREWELDDDVITDGDFVMDGYSITPTRQKSFDLDDVNLDHDDYEYKQEEINGLESEDAEPIAVDRYFRRLR
jgi:hypothetical protein|tara:strand:- start:2678 stop:2977 length:300 start_codon:yes stop_codon:yes gene_type:complete